MSSTLIQNVRVIGLEEISSPTDVLIKNGKIVAIGSKLRGDDVIDGGGNYLAPGFIDLHIHGSAEFLADDGPEAYTKLCKLLPKFGCTGFLPTLCPRPAGEDAEYLASVADIKSEGAEILGIHLEGPFLTLTGALPKEALGEACIDRVNALIKAGGGKKIFFSIAPDFEGIEKLLPTMVAAAGNAFITHNRANTAQAMKAVELGATHGTHFYDVFPIPEETDPGVRPCGSVEVLLADPRCTVDFILDGEHVEPVAVKLALACKGPGGVCLITDANIGASLPPGKYKFMDEELEFAYPGAPARGAEGSSYPGSLAGSGLTMITAVRNAIKMLDVSLPVAVRMASANPAGVIGAADHKGQIAEGFDADVVLLDENLEVLQTIVAGKTVYKTIE